MNVHDEIIEAFRTRKGFQHNQGSRRLRVVFDFSVESAQFQWVSPEPDRYGRAVMTRVATKGDWKDLIDHHFAYRTCQLCGGHPEFDEPHTDAQRLKNERERWGVSQKDAARMLGISTYALRQIEKGRKDAEPIRSFTYISLEGWPAFSRALMMCAANGGAPKCFKCWDHGTIPDGEIRLKRGITVPRTRACECQKEEEPC